MTIHNIPEGLAVGVAFGALAVDLPSASLGGAVALAIGIGIQNFPEGSAVSVPLRREGFSRLKSFQYGQMSGMVEPVAGVCGALAVIVMQPILPYALAFAAGAMIYVVVEELIPESQLQKHTDVATIGAMCGRLRLHPWTPWLCGPPAFSASSTIAGVAMGLQEYCILMGIQSTTISYTPRRM